MIALFNKLSNLKWIFRSKYQGSNCLESRNGTMDSCNKLSISWRIHGVAKIHLMVTLRKMSERRIRANCSTRGHPWNKTSEISIAGNGLLLQNAKKSVKSKDAGRLCRDRSEIAPSENAGDWALKGIEGLDIPFGTGSGQGRELDEKRFFE